jgi:hypothetical protein
MGNKNLFQLHFRLLPSFQLFFLLLFCPCFLLLVAGGDGEEFHVVCAGARQNQLALHVRIRRHLHRRRPFRAQRGAQLSTRLVFGRRGHHPVCGLDTGAPHVSGCAFV